VRRQADGAAEAEIGDSFWLPPCQLLLAFSTIMVSQDSGITIMTEKEQMRLEIDRRVLLPLIGNIATLGKPCHNLQVHRQLFQGGLSTHSVHPVPVAR
jgi:hypothetical protein